MEDIDDYNMSQFGSCLWCTDPDHMRALLPEYCKTPAPRWADGVERDMGYCLDCVVEYHEAKQDFISTHPDKGELFTELEISRLTKVLRNEQDKDPDELEDTLRVPIHEILKYPYLLHNHEMHRLFCDVICTLTNSGNAPEISDILPGVYLLLIHPKLEVRNWAMKTARTLPPVMPNDYEDLQQVISWMISVIDFGLFEYPDMGDIAEKYTILPSHLFCTLSVKDYWLGVSVLLSSLDGVTVCSKLMQKPGGHRTLVDAVIIAIEECETSNDVTAFWPTLQCFTVLLEKLGFRMWQYLSQDANTVLEKIISHPIYLQELDFMDECIIKHPGSPPFVSQNWSPPLGTRMSPRKKSKLQSDAFRRHDPKSSHGYGSTSSNLLEKKLVFSMFVPFVQSLLDFGFIATKIISSIIKFLALKAEHIFVTDMDGESGTAHRRSESSTSSADPYKPMKCPLVEQCISVLIQLLDLFIKHKQFNLTLPDSRLWIQIFLDYVHFEAKIMTTSPNLAIPVRTNMQRRCEEFLLKILKVGVKIKCDEDCLRLFSIINKNRRNPSRLPDASMWGLTHRDMSKLITSIRITLTKLAADPNTKDDLFTVTKKQQPLENELCSSKDYDIIVVSTDDAMQSDDLRQQGGAEGTTEEFHSLCEPCEISPHPLKSVSVSETERKLSNELRNDINVDGNDDDDEEPMDTSSDDNAHSDSDFDKYELNRLSDEEINRKACSLAKDIFNHIERESPIESELDNTSRKEICEDEVIASDEWEILNTDSHDEITEPENREQHSKYRYDKVVTLNKQLTNINCDDDGEENVDAEEVVEDGDKDEHGLNIEDNFDEDEEKVGDKEKQLMEIVQFEDKDVGEDLKSMVQYIHESPRNIGDLDEGASTSFDELGLSTFSSAGVSCRSQITTNEEHLPDMDDVEKYNVEDSDDIILISDSEISPKSVPLLSLSDDDVKPSEEELQRFVSKSEYNNTRGQDRMKSDTESSDDDLTDISDDNDETPQIQTSGLSDNHWLRRYGMLRNTPLVVLKRLTQSEIEEACMSKKKKVPTATLR